ncbi:MAG: hypothetical protein ACR2NU_13595 [Aeoliella sp.]
MLRSMELRQSILALQGDNLADISPELAQSDAANLLACWTSLWHPSLLARTREVPHCEAVDTLVAGEPDPHTLVLVPTIAKSGDVADWQAAGALSPLVGEFASRPAIIAAIEDSIGGRLAASGEVAGEFYALGFAYLQVEVLTRSMHYEPLISQPALSTAVSSAADAALAGDIGALDTHLADAYDLLAQARNHYYPIDFYLIDLSLVAVTTCGDSFVSCCNSKDNGNYLLTGEVLEYMATHEPASLAALRDAVSSGRASICGGSQSATPLATLSPEALLAEMQSGLATFGEYLGHQPTVFAHHHGPLAPLVPGVLRRLDYTGAITTNFAGAACPPTTSTRTTWIGLDGALLEAMNAAPLDMGCPSTLLGLFSAMSGAMDYDVAATLMLVGWPGHRCEFYDDLLRVARRSRVLGQLVTLDEYFDVTTASDYAGGLSADDYPAPPVGVTPADRPAPSNRLVQLARFAGADCQEEAAPGEQLADLLGEARGEPGILTLNCSSCERRSVPGFGWRWEPLANLSPPAPRAEPGVLRNEKMEVWFDDQTGGISAVRLHNHRGNLLSQRLTLTNTNHHQIAFDQMEIVSDTATLGVLVSAGRIVDRQGATVAKLRQTTTLHQASQRIEIEVESTPLGDHPIGFSLASRMAFRDPSASLRRGLQGVNLPTSRRNVVSEWMQVVGEPMPVAVVSDQPRTHRRLQERWIETLLFDEPSQRCVARLSYLLDCRYPALARAEEVERGNLVTIETSRPAQPVGWWLHVSSRNLYVTNFAVEEQAGESLLRLRILETEGRQVKTSLAAWRPFACARLVDFHGEPEQQLTIEDGAVQLHLAAYEWVELVAAW